ncbi:DUF998 domain-containing protein [Patescibacteria group bacterium]|nr:DUF998 domain-containing protein [Patescibacteria group bacterium]MBU1703364.1 DUF998 domain-containing protein [Patescibacteria group bacterium]MBU1953583.1 DUF998 domain-containing protein [Patescibacteria group bacterium]
MFKKIKHPNVGILLFLGPTQLFLCMVVAAALYPNYNIANNYISDLGMAGSSAAWLFNISILLFGASVMLAANIMRSKNKLFALLALLTGLGFFGVGIFPADFAVAHLTLALIGFIFGGMMMIAAFKLKLQWFGQISVLLGLFSLIATGLLLADLTLGLGIGGMERLAFYPILIWTASFGGILSIRKNN